MNNFNIVQTNLDLDKLDKKIDEFRFSNKKEPYILMSSETLQLFKRVDCPKFHVLTLFNFGKMKKATVYKYSFYIILVNDFLEEGVIGLR